MIKANENNFVQMFQTWPASFEVGEYSEKLKNTHDMLNAIKSDPRLRFKNDKTSEFYTLSGNRYVTVTDIPLLGRSFQFDIIIYSLDLPHILQYCATVYVQIFMQKQGLALYRGNVFEESKIFIFPVTCYGIYRLIFSRLIKIHTKKSGATLYIKWTYTYTYIWYVDAKTKFAVDEDYI